MMRNKLLLFCGALMMMFVAIPHSSTQAWSLFPPKVCNVTDESGQKNAACQQAQQQTKNNNPVVKLIGQAANLLALIAGVVAVIMIVIAGFQFVTSGGNTEQTTKARGRIIGAIIGLVIIALSWTIIRLVTDTILK